MNKNDLLRIIEEQKIKLEKYEKKLKDVIGAYKSLLTEKTALEQSLKALASGEAEEENAEELNKTGSTRQPGSCVQLMVTSSSEKSFDLSDTSENKPADDRESVASSEDTEDSTLRAPSDRNQAKFATLKRALATISAEKSRQEVAFTEDRKRLINEQETLQCQITKLEEENQMAKVAYEQQIYDLRSNIRQMQGERECEHSDHGAMLKELQQKMAQERSQNEHLQKQINTLSAEVKTKEQQPMELLERISILNGEIAKLKEKLSDADAKVKEIPNLLKLQNDLAQTKAQHQLALEKERTSSRELHRELIKLRNQNEEHVGALENKISEFVASVGDFERKKCDDAELIENLKSKIRQLENENHILSTNVGNFSKNGDEEESYNDTVSKCKQIVQKLKSYQGAKEPQDIITAIGLSEDDGLHNQCKKDFDQLKDEFEKYKLRAQALLKSKSVPKEFQDDAEIESLRQTVVSLQQKLLESKELHGNSERRYQVDLEELRRSVNVLKETHSRVLLELEQKCQRRICTIESETLKQRERTMEVLVEKEKEIAAMRAILSVYETGASPRPSSSVKMRSESRSSFHSVEGGETDYFRRGASDNDVLATPADPAPTNLYYTQEMARKEKEITQLKRDLRRLESQLIETQHSVVTKELVHFEITEKLKDEIRNIETKLARCSDNSNLEYLKNVFVQFALCNDSTNKQHMLKAIAVALKLSAKETDVLLKHYVKNAWFVKSLK